MCTGVVCPSATAHGNVRLLEVRAEHLVVVGMVGLDGVKVLSVEHMHWSALLWTTCCCTFRGAIEACCKCRACAVSFAGASRCRSIISGCH